MTALRRIARPLLASVFISGGAQTLRNPEAVADSAESVVAPIAERVSPSLENTEQAVRINAAVHVVAGGLLALGRLPRLSALALAVTLVPTTLAGHRFWEAEDPGERAQQQIHFFKNASLLGGLLIAAADTGGKPSLNWRAQHAAQHAAQRARRDAVLVRRTARATGPARRRSVTRKVSLPGR
ncbi:MULTISPECIES: DoxX family protein [Streptomyces]|uniref:DoxX family protein n=1 Tax=Streptomyces lycii TaxID=2654337 RepID=A0ABQ7FBQ7_9ACTN|nr:MULTISPECIES: DoxX family protein [Streptomyces]KAF4405124.1 DoxX family protein [Streptomyces lycii]PGH47489.1 DoxX family protein [Streptomyces sp. Ru87]